MEIVLALDPGLSQEFVLTLCIVWHIAVLMQKFI